MEGLTTDITILIILSIALAIALNTLWIWGLVRLFTGGHVVWGVVALLLPIVSLAGFLMAPKAGSARDLKLRRRHEAATYPAASAPLPPIPAAQADHAFVGGSGPQPPAAGAELYFPHYQGSEATLTLPAGTTLVGRESDADVQIANDYISRRHASFSLDRGRLLMRDLGSANGTRVNGQRIADWTELHDGDEVHFARMRALVRLNGSQTAVLQSPQSLPPPVSSGSAAGRRVFMSYASEDRQTVENLADLLRGAGWDVWFDQRELSPGQHWGRRISAAVAESSVVLAVVTPASLGSQWVDAELQHARRNDRPVLGVVMKWADPHLIDDRLGLYLGRQRMDLSSIGGALGGPELQTLSDTLAALADEREVRPPNAGQRRLGTALIVAGVVALAASITWLFLAFIAAFERFGDFAGNDAGPGGFSEAQADFERYVDALVSVVYVLPALVASVALIVAGIAVRRSARRKALQGR